MHDRANPSLMSRLIPTLLVVGVSLFGLIACGGDDSRRRVETTWEQDQRLPMLAEHWWWTPVETACEEDRECPSGERCQRVRLGTCPECPRGEDHNICVPRDTGSNGTASRRRCTEAGSNTPGCY